MKKISSIKLIGFGLLMLGTTSCKKFLDINQNTNSATSATPELILPQAITATAGVLNSYNNYGSQLVGYMANAGGYGGFGTAISYNFATSDHTYLWSGAFDNLEDYQSIIDQTSSQLSLYAYHNAAARIMKAYTFELLVDAFNDIPYTEALKGANSLTPKYDKAADVYVSLANQLDSAIKTIDDASSVVGVKPLGTADVLFAGNMTSWKQFANTIKLRLIIHANGKASFANTTFSADGFLIKDALVDPGYTRDNGKQNQQWNSWVYSYTGSDANKAWIPTTFIMGFFDGHTILDSGRGKASFYQYPKTGTNQLGYQNVDVPKCPSGSFWYSGTNRTGSSAGNSRGILKGPDAGFPAMLAAESYFLQAEAAVRGLISGADAKALFNSGVAASFNYLYQKPDGSLDGNPTADVTTYQNDNKGSYLVNFDLATSNDQKIEAIITQKYVALDFIAGHEAWNEYRRTHYPSINPTGGAYRTFASTVSESTRPDKLPTRVRYPDTENLYNPTNVPKDISPFNSFIFWALQ